MKAGRVDQATQVLGQTLEAMRRILGRDHPNTLRAQSNLAAAYREQGRADEAVPLLEDAFQKRLQFLGQDNTKTQESLLALAFTYIDVRRPNNAISLLEQGLNTYLRELPPDDTAVLMVKETLAAAYQESGEHDRAIGVLGEAASTKLERLGADHPESLTTLNTLALAFAASGRWSDAVQLLRYTIYARESNLGPEHPDLVSRYNLAIGLINLGLFQEALVWLEPVIGYGRQQEMTGIDRGLASRSPLIFSRIADDSVKYHSLDEYRALFEAGESDAKWRSALLNDLHELAPQLLNASPMLWETRTAGLRYGTQGLLPAFGRLGCPIVG